jgi:hypothetical protein
MALEFSLSSIRCLDVSYIYCAGLPGELEEQHATFTLPDFGELAGPILTLELFSV